MFAKTSIVALFAGLVAAQHAPVGEPSGNPITAPLTQIVPACEPFTITWQPTTPNAVSLVLLRGPAENIKPLATIVTGIPNSGSFKWTPSSSLEADTTHYGLQIIDDITGQFQYSNQFGISKGAECEGQAPASSSTSDYGVGYPTGYPASTPAPSASSMSHHVSSMASHYSSIMSKPSASAPYGTGMPHGNTSVIQPTKPISSVTLLPSGTGAANATRSAPPEITGNAASSVQAGLGFAGVFAAFAFML